MTSYFIFLAVGYCVTVSIELPILWYGLHRNHSAGDKVFAGFWLTACTYPIVVLVLPQMIAMDENRPLYLTIAESFAVTAECALFMLLETSSKQTRLRDCIAITAANLASFGIGEVFYRLI